MDHAPQPHHREGIQEQLDKAYDEGHRDNEAINNAEAAIGSYKREIAEIKGVTDEVGEAVVSHELEPVLSRLREKGYLDASFEGKEVHNLEIRPLTEEQALSEYRNSGGEIRYSVIQENFPYTMPKQENLDVMIMKFDQIIRDSDDVIVEMNNLGVRPLAYEELIQYVIANPSNEQLLVALGSKHDHAAPRHWVIGVNSYERRFDSLSLVSRSEGDRFPVTPK